MVVGEHGRHLPLHCKKVLGGAKSCPSSTAPSSEVPSCLHGLRKRMKLEGMGLRWSDNQHHTLRVLDLGNHNSPLGEFEMNLELS